MFRLVRKIPLLFAALSLLALLTSAPTASAASYKKEWKIATAQPAPTNTILGAWEGTWNSAAHGVSGPLRCIITENGKGRYKANFHARFHWFRFTYVADLIADQSSGALRLTGNADLGWMGGVYHYSGTASPTRYSSTYKSEVEHGILDLKRPELR